MFDEIGANAECGTEALHGEAAVRFEQLRILQT